jgi:pyrroline-5-carboxylate reductase
MVADPALTEVPAGVRLVAAPPQGGEFDAILLGVKPQLLGQVAAPVAALAGEGSTLFSILAGTELALLEERFPAAGAIVRVMPNLSAALGKSPIALTANTKDAQLERTVAEFFQPLGAPEWIDESAFDLVTALAGSGPAFVYRFIDALSGAATALGLPADQAARLALATVEGAVALAASSDVDPGELARRVASPGGTTQAGLDVLDEDGRIGSLLRDTLRAARDRSAEMAAEARAPH